MNKIITILLLMPIIIMAQNPKKEARLRIRADKQVLTVLKAECVPVEEHFIEKTVPDCLNSNEIMGYMISIVRSKNEEDIDKIASRASTQYTTLRQEKGYSHPEWRLFIGDYFTKESAANDLTRIRKIYPSAIIVQERIYCSRAK